MSKIKKFMFHCKNLYCIDTVFVLDLWMTRFRNVFNPIALRKAKIVYNFGLSECSRVKLEHQSLVVHATHTLSGWFKRP